MVYMLMVYLVQEVELNGINKIRFNNKRLHIWNLLLLICYNIHILINGNFSKILMKKLLLGLFSLSYLFFVVPQVQAGWVSDAVMKQILQFRANLGASGFNAYPTTYYGSGTGYGYGSRNNSSLNNDNPSNDLGLGPGYGSQSSYTGGNNSSQVSLSDSTTPRVMFSVGKYDQHFDMYTQTWKTDSDLSMNGYLDILSYCKKWYPDTINTRVYKQESINTWEYSYKNHNNDFVKSMSYECIQGAVVPNLVSISTITTDKTPRISYWPGKVNQHVDVDALMWKTDSDGTSGYEIDKLSYCQKWYPKTTSVSEYKSETINSWQDRGNINEYSSAKMSYRCVEPTVVSRDAYVDLVYPKSGETFKAGQNVEIKIDSNLTRLGAFRALIYRRSYGNQYTFIKKFDTANSGVQTIKIPSGTPSGEYKIEYGHIFSDNDYTQYGTAIFNIGISPTSSIKLISPASGSKLQAGQTVNVKWSKSSNLSDSWVDVIIKKNGEVIRQISINNDGQEYIKIPSSTPPGLYDVSIGIQHHQSSGGSGSNYFEELGSATVNITSSQRYDVCSHGELYNAWTGQPC